VIILTRLGGHALAVNPDLIERAESTPDTVLTMVDGHKLVVGESLDEVVELIRSWRATVAAQAYSLSREPDPAAYARHPSAVHLAPDEPGPDYGIPSGVDDQDDDLSTHTAIQASLARVLRLPQRGE
jgi:flagellar protein FlbD